MKQKTKARRVINLPKDDYDKIKEYCNIHSLNMSKWIVNIIMSILSPTTNTNLQPFGLSYAEVVNREFIKCENNPSYLTEHYGTDDKLRPSWLRGFFDEQGNIINKKESK